MRHDGELAETMTSIEQLASPVRDAAALIRRAAELGILHMPDNNSVVVCVRYGDEEQWEQKSLFEASVDLVNSGYMLELQAIVDEKEENENKKENEI